jgi:hypothetical protein
MEKKNTKMKMNVSLFEDNKVNTEIALEDVTTSEIVRTIASSAIQVIKKVAPDNKEAAAYLLVMSLFDGLGIDLGNPGGTQETKNNKTIEGGREDE